VTLPVRFADPGPAGISPEEPGIFVEGKRISEAAYRKVSEGQYLVPIAFRYGNTRMRHIFVFSTHRDPAGSWQSFRYDLKGAQSPGRAEIPISSSCF
jgi:hypothetical protein